MQKERNFKTGASGLYEMVGTAHPTEHRDEVLPGQNAVGEGGASRGRVFRVAPLKLVYTKADDAVFDVDHGQNPFADLNDVADRQFESGFPHANLRVLLTVDIICRLAA